MAKAKDKISKDEIVALRWELDKYYRLWHDQQREDEAWYNAGKSGVKIAAKKKGQGFDEVKPPTGKTIVDTAAEHASGNFPRIHIPRKKATDKADLQADKLEKFTQGFWYRAIAEAPQNPIRAWAQLGALRGAICASLLYDEDKWPNPDDYKDESDLAAQQKTAWPFVLDWVDPLTVFPDPATEGKEFIIIAFNRMAHEIKRRWPAWDMKVPGRVEPVKLTDKVDFIAYWDKKYYAYIISGGLGQESYGGKSLIRAYDGVAPHGYGFLPYFFISAGYGMPTGTPETRYQGFLTQLGPLLAAEARRMTQLDIIIAQQASPWIAAHQSVKLDMQLGGVTRVPDDQRIQDAIVEFRPQIPVSEIVVELGMLKQRISSATIPDTLAGEKATGVYSGYHESVLVGTGRARLRPLSDALEHTVEWATSGSLKIVENVIKAPVSVWGRGMKANEFITISPDDINGAYEVYADLTPDLPQDTSVNIANGERLFKAGIIPGRDWLETYAGRENANELIEERMVDDTVAAMKPQMVQDALAGFGIPTAVPSAPEAVQVAEARAGNTPSPSIANPGQVAGPKGGVTGIPTPPNPVSPAGGPLQGIQRGNKNGKA